VKNDMTISEQLTYMERRAARARANPEAVAALMEKIFGPLSDEDRVTVDPEKAAALAAKLAADHQHNLEVLEKTGVLPSGRRIF
jgi:hypothetical protein